MKNFIGDRKRWIPLLSCIILSVIIWNNRTAWIYAHLPVLFRQQNRFLFDLLLAALAFTVFICIIQETRCPFWIKMRVDRAFQRAGLKNGIGEHPVLVAVTNDLRKPHGKRYTVNNKGIPIEAMAEKRDSLQQEIGVIYELTDSPNIGKSYLFVLSGKSSPPIYSPIVYDHDF